MTEPDQSIKAPARAVISLGSNLPDRLGHLSKAVRTLRAAPGINVVSVSGVYESQPVGEGLTGDFLNACVVCDVGISPHELLALCRKTEEQAGRDRDSEKRTGVRDRKLDLDIIFYGDLECGDAELTLPHARWDEREFVVLPLLDVRHDLTAHQRRLLDGSAQNLNLRSGSCRRVTEVLN